METISLKELTGDNSDVSSILDEYKEAPETLHADPVEPSERSESDSGVSFNSENVEDSVLSGEVFTGLMLITLIESVFPLIIGILSDKFDDRKVDVKKLKMTAAQRKEVTPICDAIVKQLEIKANPFITLGIALTSIYGLNYFALRQEAPIKEKKDLFVNNK